MGAHNSSVEISWRAIQAKHVPKALRFFGWEILGNNFIVQGTTLLFVYNSLLSRRFAARRRLLLDGEIPQGKCRWKTDQEKAKLWSKNAATGSGYGRMRDHVMIENWR